MCTLPKDTTAPPFVPMDNVAKFIELQKRFYGHKITESEFLAGINEIRTSEGFAPLGEDWKVW